MLKTGDFTHFHLHTGHLLFKKVNAPLKPEWRGAGVSNDWCIRNITPKIVESENRTPYYDILLNSWNRKNLSIGE